MQRDGERRVERGWGTADGKLRWPMSMWKRDQGTQVADEESPACTHQRCSPDDGGGLPLQVDQTRQTAGVPCRGCEEATRSGPGDGGECAPPKNTQTPGTHRRRNQTSPLNREPRDSRPTKTNRPRQTGALRPKNGEMRQMGEAGLRDADVGPTRGDVGEGNA